MKKTHVIGLMLVLLIPISYAESLELFSVIQIKDKKSLSLFAWPNKKAKLITQLSSTAMNIEYLGKQRSVGHIRWMKVQWQGKQGWVDGSFLIDKPKPINHPKSRVNRNHQRDITQNPLSAPIEESIFSNLNQHAIQYEKPMEDPPFINVKTKTGTKAHVFTARRLQHFKLSCQGSKSNKWRIKINMKTKRMWVNLTNTRTYSIPITYSRWDNDDRKRLLVIAGRGKKHVKATIKQNKSCRLDYSKQHYTYSINAKVARVGHLLGCCSDISH